MRQDRLQDTFAILEHLVVPEAKHFPAVARQIRVTDSVAPTFRVLETVSLDDQLSANAKKVDDIRAEGNLPTKLEAVQTSVAKEAPEAKLSLSRRTAHRASARALAS
jgi:hypothetical protein